MERDRIAAMMRDLQDAICAGLESFEAGARFGREEPGTPEHALLAELRRPLPH
ncbi:MAG: hypothetical protein ACYSUM_16000 [Planctomycetota bacterium]|jgi:hypothetical protein